MKYVYIPVYGGRSHSDINPKVSKEEELHNWYLKDIENNSPKYFISFTNINKISINPQFEFKNPIGIYTYPLRLVYREHKPLDVSFASDRKYIQVLKVNAPQKNILNSSSYTSSDYQRDVHKLKFIFDTNKHKFNFDKIKKNYNKLNSFIVLNLEDIFNYDKILQLIETNYRTLCTLVDAHDSQCKRVTVRNPYFSKIWILSMLISVLLSKGNYTVTWNKVLQQIGYKVVIDDNTGTIHPREPKQGLFLSSDSYKLVDTIYNNQTPLDTFISFLYKNKIPFSSEKKNSITIFDDVKIGKMQISSLPSNLVIEGELSLNHSTFLSPINSLTANSFSLVDSDIIKFPRVANIDMMVMYNQKIHSISSSTKIETFGCSNSQIEVIRKGARIKILLLNDSIIKKIEKDACIDQIVISRDSKILNYPEELTDKISHKDIQIPVIFS